MSIFLKTFKYLADIRIKKKTKYIFVVQYYETNSRQRIINEIYKFQIM